MASGSVRAGIVIISGDDSDDGTGHCSGTSCGSLFVNAFNLAISSSLSPGTGIVAIGVNGSRALTALNSWNSAANGGPGVPITILTTAAQITGVNLSNFDIRIVNFKRTGGCGAAILRFWMVYTARVGVGEVIKQG